MRRFVRVDKVIRSGVARPGRPRGPRDPCTAAEWQEAEDLAHGALALAAARRYGLAEEGPGVDAGRCLELLDAGRRRGYAPAPDAAERFLVTCLAGGKPT
jgi:hypothetical protein